MVDPHASLAALAEKYGTDKVPNCDIYESYLAPLRDQKVNLFEIGVGGYDDPQAGGGSVRMWKEYFARGKIFALDYYDKSPHSEDRISIYKGSQDDRDTLLKIAADMGVIDVILDDGSHVSPHVIASFNILFPLLRSGGLYIVEDIGTSYWEDHGGSPDFNAEFTSVSFFKRLIDGIQHPFFKHRHQLAYLDRAVKFIHFYPNIIVIRKS